MAKLNKIANKRLISTSVGALVAMVGSVVVANQIKENATIGNYAKEVAGAGMVAGGSFLMSQKDSNIKNAGIGVGSVGGAMLAKGVYNKVTGSVKALDPINGNDQVTDNTDNSDDEDFGIPGSDELGYV